MPKLKSHSGTKDRVRITKNGKVLHGHSSTNHFLKKQSAASKRRKAVTGMAVGKMAKNIKLKLGA
jgi:large subunit ribosomal protein L35